MTLQLLIAGAGIGGLAAARACASSGCEVRLYEQAAALSEVGAGIQLGPNSTRILKSWGLGDALAAVSATPRELRVRSAVDGSQLGILRLGADIAARYGSPYVTVHRADLQQLLLAAAGAVGVSPALSSPVTQLTAQDQAVRIRTGRDFDVEGDALIGADGLWSVIRTQAWRDPEPTYTGHLAYRSLVAQRDLPQRLRTGGVTVWLGPAMHLVSYPVRGGDELNVVMLVQTPANQPRDMRDWDQQGAAGDVRQVTNGLCAPLQELVQAMPAWRLWALHDRSPMTGADEMARGRVALLGDAAHPMLPYFAQGAGMAIEDAAGLAHALTMAVDRTIDVPLALRRYALNRWQRSARVQRLSRRNGRIFHATGLVRWGRDVSLRLLGERLLDQPWLYAKQS